MVKLRDPFFEILKRLCNTPTAPYHEQRVMDEIGRWLAAENRSRCIRYRTDVAGNIHLEYRKGRKGCRTLVLEAHLDHPGFVVTGTARDGTIRAIFRGGVKPSCFVGSAVALWIDSLNTASDELPTPIVTRVLRATPAKGRGPMRVTLAPIERKIPRGTIATWNLPDASVEDNFFMARACDDLAGVAACLCVLDRLLELQARCNVTVLLTRAEEVGFAGAIAVAKGGLISRHCAVLGLETSRATAQAVQGAGPVIRVGDRTSTFSPAFTRFMAMIAGGIADESADFRYQRALMDGGTCDSTVFHAFGYETGAICLALGNYHNMLEAPATAGLQPQVPTAGPLIGSETIHLSDFAGEVELLAHICVKFPRYKPGMDDLKKRFSDLHKNEQRALLQRDGAVPSRYIHTPPM